MNNYQKLKATYQLAILILLFILPIQLNSQCLINCKGSSNITLNDDCTALITAANILRSDEGCSGPMLIEVYDSNGQLIPTSPLITGDYVGQTVELRATDTASGFSCSAPAYIEDKTPPIIFCQNETIGCTDDVPMATASDACGPVDLEFTEWISLLNCNTGDFTYQINRYYVATDQQGMTATCIQEVLVRKPDPTDIVFPPDFDDFDQPALDCSAPDSDPDITGRPTINGDPIEDYCRLHAWSTDDTTSICQGTIKIFRTWKVASWCSSSIIAERTQFIKILDTTGPAISCPSDTTYSTDFDICGAEVTLSNATATDDCSSPENINITIDWDFGTGNGPFFNIPIGIHTVTYTATDDCGNTNTCTMQVTVEDKTPPTTVCETIRELTLSGDSTKFFAPIFDDGSRDNCGVVDSFTVRREGETIFAECIYFSCADLGQNPLIVVLRVCDDAGNCSECDVMVNLEDKELPEIDCPDDITLSCADYPAPISVTGMATATDNCTPVNVTSSDVVDINDCKTGTVTRTFVATDVNGLTSSCQQIITYEFSSATYTFPENTSVECLKDATVDNTGNAMASSSCTNVFYIAFQDDTITLVEDCKFVIRRNFGVLDDCDTPIERDIQIIEVEDTTPPFFQPNTATLNFSCARDVTPFSPTPTDNCDDNPDITITGTNTVPGSCPDNFVTTITYTATDDCGNVSDPFTLTINVDDQELPTADALPNLGPYACLSGVPAANINDVLNETDNCSDDVTVSFVGDGTPPPCAGTYLRIYQITDRCGNVNTLTQQITLNDSIPPTADTPADLVFSCAEDVPDADINDVLNEMDNCGGMVTVSIIDNDPIPDENGNAEYKFQVTDVCGNTTEIIQNIMLEDSTPPTAAPPDPIGPLSCITDVPPADPNDLMNVDDNCTGDVLIRVDDEVNNITCMGTFDRVYTLVDMAGNMTQVTQKIIIKDSIPPSFNEMPDSLNIVTDCANNINIIAPTATDLCNNAVVSIASDMIQNQTCLNRYQRIIEYVATDDCGNISDPFQLVVSVFDNESPTAAPIDPAGPFACPGDYPPNNNIVTNIQDNCDGGVTVDFMSDSAPPACQGNITRTYLLTDVCGNTNTVTQTIMIDDQTAPTADPLDDLGPYTCASLVPAVDISILTNVMDNCGGMVDILPLPDQNIVRCTGTYTRRYQLTDQCNNITVITQNIIINDNIAPILVPGSDTIGIYECRAAVPDSIFNHVMATDNCGDEVIVELLPDDGNNRPVCEEVYIQSFRLTDVCGNNTVVQRSIIMKDTIAPIWTTPMGSLNDTMECMTDTRGILPIAEDRCNQVFSTTIVSTDTIFFECANSYTQRFGYVATDGCGNETMDTFFVELTAIDTTAPVFTSCPTRDTVRLADRNQFNQPADCMAPYSFTVAATDNCEVVNYYIEIVDPEGITTMIDGPTIDQLFPIGTSTITFYAEDACGNVSSCSVAIIVRDAAGPFFFCNSNQCIELSPGEIVTRDADSFLGAKIDCSTPITTIFEESQLNTITVSYDDLNGMSSVTTTITAIAIDAVGNESACEIELTLVDFTQFTCDDDLEATVAGALHNEMGLGIQDVTVTINGPNGDSTSVTDATGRYILPDIEMDLDYRIQPQKDDDLLNGITTMDLLMLSAHLLNIDTLDTPYQLIAADINNSGEITISDIIALRRAILIIDDHFDNNTSWRFVDSEFEFPNPANPFATEIPDVRYIHELSDDLMDMDFMSIKVGDLNNSATGNGLQAAGDTRSVENLEFTTKDQILEAGKTYDIAFKATNFKDIKGYQFTIDFDPTVLAYEPVDQLSGTLNLSEANFGFKRLEEGLITTSWFDINAVTLSKEETVFTLRFFAKSDARLSDVLQFNDQLIDDQSYSLSNDQQGVTLSILPSLLNSGHQMAFDLLQNRPNPFRQQTIIPFVLPEEGMVKMTITDVSGRTILVREGHYPAGYQEMTIERNDLNASGVLFYQLECGSHQAIRKMVIAK